LVEPLAEGGLRAVQARRVDEDHLGVGRWITPRTLWRVVFGRAEVIDTLVPTIVFTSVDLPRSDVRHRGESGPHDALSPSTHGGRPPARSLDADPADPATFDLKGHQPESVHLHRFALLWHPTGQIEQEPPDRVPGALGQPGVEQLVRRRPPPCGR